MKRIALNVLLLTVIALVIGIAATMASLAAWSNSL